MVLLCMIAAGCFVKYKEYCRVINEYNSTAREYNSVLEKFKQKSNKTEVANIEGMDVNASEVEELNTDWRSIVDYVQKQATTKIIDEGREYMITESTNLKDAMLIMDQITCPSENWVVDRLKKVNQITDMQAVDKNNNPDGLLGKKGGYKACVYFAIDTFDSSDIPGKDIVAKGVDVGGSVEVYETLEDAKARCDYLAQFEDTILYSGSYALVGTMVIRTTYILSSDKQNELTNEIVKAFTAME